jgi:formylmethanofuran dehydrogenase subunit E
MRTRNDVDDPVIGWVVCQMCGVTAPAQTTKRVQGHMLCLTCRKRVRDDKIVKCKSCGRLDAKGAMFVVGDGLFCERCASEAGVAV